MALKQQNPESFCQRAPIFLDYLHSILQKYPDGGQILKELVQNADDAGANEVVFVSDEREFDITSGGLEGTQGPALLAYNDALMSPRDWAGILSPGVSHKRKDPSTVGRFGLGFTSVYHLTDLPGVLSPPSLGMLDPECQVLSGAGARWDVSAAQLFPGLFEPFLAGLEAVGQHRGSAQGTLFRFPLRRQPSGIAAGVSSPERLRNLLQSFLTEAPLALLFLRHVRRVALHRVAPDGVQTLMGTLVASFQPLPVPGPSQYEGMSLAWSLVTLHGDGVGDRNEWLVTTGRATEGPAVALGTGLGCCPELSLAHPLHGPCQGQLCCFLPLPATDETVTGLPVHVNAPFALSDDRRHLRWPEEGKEGEEDARWNALLLHGLLPQLYSHMAAVVMALPGADAYSIWPDPQHMPSCGRIRSLVTHVCHELAAACTLVPATEGAAGQLRASEAVLLPEVAGDMATQQAVQALLMAAREPVAEVPAHVRRALALGMSEGLREATAGYVREVLRRHGTAGLSAAQCLSLLLYVASDGRHDELRGLPLLPRADGTFVAFGTASATVYVDTSDCPRELLPGLAGSFLLSGLEPALDNLLRGIAKSGIFPNLVLLDPAVTAQTLRLALPPTWTSQSSTPVTWCPAQGPPQPPASWLQAMWQFLSHHVEDLGPLEGLPLIPLSPLSAPSVCLAPLVPQSGLIFQVWEDQCLPLAVASVLEALGCPVVPPSTWHRSLSRYVLPPSPLNALRALGRQGAAVVASRLASLPAADVATLRLYLADVPSLTKQDRDTLAALPLFRPLPCLATPQPTGLVPAGTTPVLEPGMELPRDVLLPEAMLQCQDEVDRQLLGRLQRSLISAAHVALQAIRAVAQGVYAGRAAETQALLLWVLQHGDVFFAQNPPLQQACSRLAFLETPKGPMCPRDLYDPCESTLRALLGPEHFPPDAFHSPPVLRALRVLGLRHGEGCLVPSDILEAAASVSQGDAVALDRAQALVKVCNWPKALDGFSIAMLRQLQALPWVPCSMCTGKSGQLFLPPEELRSTQYQALVGLAMPLTGAFVPEAEKRLGLSQTPPPERVWEQLKLLAESRNLGEVGSALRPVYQHMQENLKNFQSAPDDAVVWTGSGFVLPRDAVLGYPEELELGMLVPRVPPDFLPYSYLFRAWGVQSSVSEERVAAALRCLGQDIDARSSGAGTTAELQVAVAVLEWLKSRGHQGEGTVPVPVRIQECSGFALRPAASTVYLDMELEEDEDVQEVVHEAVPSSTAIFFGTELLSTRVLGPEPFTACSLSEPITLRLRNILREYGDEGDIFTEMVQNAEDAGATVCSFLLDLRRCRKATSGLLDPGMAACHGPALWAYNNALFTEDDFCNITRVGAATKEGQADKIGRFGLGFSSVYRVTDVPAILSGETLLIFDPNGTHLGKHIPRAGSSGIRLDFSSRPRILRAFAEQFWPYHGIFGCCLPEPGPFPGSLFRLPFRTEEEAVTSQICSEAFGTERIQSLGTSFLGSNRLLLLFLQKVREMSLEILPDMATVENTVHLVRLQQKKIQDLRPPGDLPGWAAIEQLTACEEGSQTTWHYLVLVCQGDGEMMELFHRNTEAGLHPLPPMAGVALPLAPTADGKWMPQLGAEEGQVFCHLPMPINSGLPIHVHGTFSILSNRKGLWDTAQRGEWNRRLLRNAVPLAWIQALDQLRTMHEAGELKSYEYHTFWPDINTARYPFTEAVTGFYQAVADRNGPRLFSDGCSWCSLQDARFLHQAVVRHPRLGAVAKHVFATTLPHPLLAVTLPEHVQRGLGKAVDDGTYDWPRFYCQLVLPNLKDLSHVDRDSLILHALDLSCDDVDKVLQTVPCIPVTPQGHLQLINHLVHPRGRIASLYDPMDGRFPTGDDFLSPERLSRLERLGMVKDTLTLSQLLDRAKTVQFIWTKDRAQGCRRAACILEVLRDAVHERMNNTMQAAFRTVPFLPGTLPTGEHVLLPAAELYNQVHAPLVGLIHPVLAPEVLGVKFSFPGEVLSFLGLQREIPAAIVLQQLEALRCSSNILPLEKLQDSTNYCYRYLNMLLQRDDSSWGKVASAVAQGEPFILVGSCFVPVKSVAETLSFEAAPYLHQLPEQYQPYSQLWKCVGLRHRFTWDDYSQVLHTLAKTYPGEPLSATELGLALRLVSCGLMEDDKKPDAYQIQQLFLPDQEGILHPQDKLHFNDTPWMQQDKDVLLCHDQLSRTVALHCGVPTTRHQTLENCRLPTAVLSLWPQPFGAHEELTTRLKNILCEYPASAHDIVRELLQNADDAGASVVHFVWDRRQHSEDAIFSDSWKFLQGPALCIYNDRPFQQDDIDGIQRLGVGSKQDRQDVTGQYGLGFNTVFHFTDCPAFLTGDSALCIFDPHCHYIPGATPQHPGGMFAVNSELKTTFPGIYDTFLPSFFNLNKGVLFRLPLRTARGAHMSKVSDMVVRDQDLMALQRVLAEEGEDLMLFLRHLRTVIFSEIPPDGKQMLERIQVTTELTDSDAELRQAFQARLSQATPGDSPTSVSYTMTVKTSKAKPSTMWRVISQIGVQEEAEKSPVPGKLPCGAVAACLKPRCSDKFVGKTFCTLPLPLTTGLPVHINANFFVNAARRSLLQDPNCTKAAWNIFLLRHLVAPLYSALLTSQWEVLGPGELWFHTLKDCQKHLIFHYLRFFPVVEETPPTFQELVRDVYRHLVHTDLPLVPVYQVKPPQSEVRVTWAPPGYGNVLTKPYFLKAMLKPGLQEVLQCLNMNLVPAFTDLRHIYRGFSEVHKEVAVLEPASVRHFLKDLALPVPCILAETPLRTPERCRILLEYCMESIENVSELEGLPLLATQDGYLNALSIHHPVFTSTFAHLFPNYRRRFADRSISYLSLPCFVKELSLQEAKPLIQDALPQLKWNKEGEKWLRRLWDFFETVVVMIKGKEEESMKSLMDHLQDVAVLPVQGKKNTDSKYLLPLSSLPKVIFECRTDVNKVLHKLGIPVLQESLVPFELAYRFLRSKALQTTDPSAVVNQLANSQTSFHWGDLNEQDVNFLLNFVQGRLNLEALKQLQLLPLFQKYDGGFVSVAGYHKVLLLNSQLSELPPGAQDLFSLEEGMVLLRADKIPRQLAQDLHWKLSDHYEIFSTVVLSRLSKLKAPMLMKALRFFFALKPSSDTKFMEQTVAAFRTVAFIPDAQGVLRLASYFYDKTDSFCTLQLQHRFVPESFFVELGYDWKTVMSFLIKAGVSTTLSAEDFLTLALKIENEATSARRYSEDLLVRQQEMLEQLHTVLENTLPIGFLQRIASIRFLPPLDIPQDLINLHPPFAACTKPVALKGSVYYCKGVAKLLWTSATILPKSLELKQPHLRAMEVLEEIPTALVVDNLKQVCKAVCRTPQQVQTRVHVLQAVYTFLQTHLKDVDAEPLAELPVVLTESGDMAMPRQVVTSLPNMDDFYPYLFMPDTRIAVYGHLLQHLGVVIVPTLAHYSHVLSQIHQESCVSRTLNTKQKKTVLLATQNFFRLLEDAQEPPDFSTVTELYLLSTGDCLELSHKLYFNDCVSSSTSRALGKTFVFMAELPGTVCNARWLLQRLPKRLRPQVLSEVTEQELESRPQLCRYGSHCPEQRRLQTLLVSPWFGVGLASLLRWQSHRGMIRMEKDGVFAVKQLKVQCCENICTVMVHHGKKVEGSSQSRVIHVCLAPGAQRVLYMRHTDMVLNRHRLRVLETLTQEINTILDGQLGASALSVLREMLVCQDPQEVASVLEENDVAQVHLQWLQPAKSDLQAAHNDIRHCCPNWVIFKVHQALEKVALEKVAVFCHGEAFEARVGLAQWLEAKGPGRGGRVDAVLWQGWQGHTVLELPPLPHHHKEAFYSMDEEEILMRMQGVLGRLQDHVTKCEDVSTEGHWQLGHGTTTNPPENHHGPVVDILWTRAVGMPLEQGEIKYNNKS